ncbi:hypothetical protein FMEAI12_6990001 [Parafrankia sp. Ea1.12]|nr:hypothetical protein FMEAI12_6990001 [Parafrankia sp. Ea1.12]
MAGAGGPTIRGPVPVPALALVPLASVAMLTLVAGLTPALALVPEPALVPGPALVAALVAVPALVPAPAPDHPGRPSSITGPPSPHRRRWTSRASSRPGARPA